MSNLVAQKALTGLAAVSVAAAGNVLPAVAAPLVFDCYSRSTSDLLMKSALDLSNDNLACLQAGAVAAPYQPVATQPIYVAPAQAQAPAPSAGESFFGSVLGGAIGGVIGNAINGGNRVEHHYYEHNNNNKRQGGSAGQGKKQAPANQPAPDTTVRQPMIIPGQVGAGTALWQATQKQHQQQMVDTVLRYNQAQQIGTIKKNFCIGNPFAPGCR